MYLSLKLSSVACLDKQMLNAAIHFHYTKQWHQTYIQHVINLIDMPITSNSFQLFASVQINRLVFVISRAAKKKNPKKQFE